MLRGKRNVLLLLHLASCLILAHSQSAQTIDTTQPIIRSVPSDQDENAYFGYSVVLHQMSATSGSMTEALQNTRWVAACYRSTTWDVCMHAHIIQLCACIHTYQFQRYAYIVLCILHCMCRYAREITMHCFCGRIYHYIFLVVTHSPPPPLHTHTLLTQDNCWCPKWNCIGFLSGQHRSYLHVSGQPWTVQWIDGKWYRF